MNKRWITIPLRIIVTAVITLLAEQFFLRSLRGFSKNSISSTLNSRLTNRTVG